MGEHVGESEIDKFWELIHKTSTKSLTDPPLS